MVLLSSVHVYFDYIIFTFRVKDNSVLTVTNDDTTVAINFVPLKYHSVNVVIDLQVQLAFKKYSNNQWPVPTNVPCIATTFQSYLSQKRMLMPGFLPRDFYLIGQ